MTKREKPFAIMISIVLIVGLLCNIPSINAVDNTDYGLSNPDVKIPPIGSKKAVTIWDAYILVTTGRVIQMVIFIMQLFLRQSKMP